MLKSLKKLVGYVIDLEKRSRGTVPPSPLFFAECAIKAGRRLLSTAVPLSNKRFSGKLAKDGGMRVRDTRIRPYAGFPAHTASEWIWNIGPKMGRLFRTASEGAPQRVSKEFAQKWADYCGSGFGLLLPHGTDALKVALAATLDHDGMEYGGEVIVPNLGFIASVNAPLDRRIGVVLVDVDSQTLNLDPARVEEAIIPGKTRAIMAVHLFGQPADMKALREIAQRHSLVLLEDAAQAHGAIHELGRAGALGDAAAFSFQSSKNLSAGEGGAVTTSSREVFERADSIQNVGRAHVGARRWMHDTLGWNLRPSEYIATVLLHRLQTLEAEQQTRFSRFNLLRELLSDVSCVEPLGIGPGVVRHGVYMFVMRYKPDRCGGLVLEDFLGAVGAEGIPIYRCYAETLAQQPVLQRLAEKHPGYIRAMPSPVADQAVKEIIYLSHHIFLGTESDIHEIAAGFRKVQAFYAPELIGSKAAQPLAQPTAQFAKARSNIITKTSKTLRFGIVGFGSMGREHASALSKLEGASLTGVSDQQIQARAAAAEFNCAFYDSAEELISSGKIDVLVVATPHWQHPKLTIAGLKAGLHVICEKPLTVTVAESDEVLEVAARCNRLFSVVHQNRLQPAFKYAKRILDSGELGAIRRIDVVETYWRSEAYFKSSPWRGTWKGEGGGVLLNQAPHVLDRYAWLCGMPSSLSAFCNTTLHEIEVEDTASAILRHPNGAHGYLHINTVESPLVSRTAISCDQGSILIEDNTVTVTNLQKSIREQTMTDSRLFGSMEGRTRKFPMSHSEPIPDLLKAYYTNFIEAAAGQEPLAIPAHEGRNTVELANAMVLSSFLGREVTLPVDRRQYAEFMRTKLEVTPEEAVPARDEIANRPAL